VQKHIFKLNGKNITLKNVEKWIHFLTLKLAKFIFVAYNVSKIQKKLDFLLNSNLLAKWIKILPSHWRWSTYHIYTLNLVKVFMSWFLFMIFQKFCNTKKGLCLADFFLIRWQLFSLQSLSCWRLCWWFPVGKTKWKAMCSFFLC